MQPLSDTTSDDARRAELAEWIATLDGLDEASLVPASGDASFRRYFRVRCDRASWIAMDAPPPMEDCRPFVTIAGFLRAISLSAPDIVAADVERGFLLMTDFGDRTYLDALGEQPDAASGLYRDALDALLTLQVRGARFRDRLPPYDARLLRQETALFPEWLCGRHLGIELTGSEQRRWDGAIDLLLDSALEQPRVFVHRDYHSRNLMVRAAGNPGIIDFQDAMNGPLTYDLVSLLKDCYIELEPATIDAACERFRRGLDSAQAESADADTLRRWFDLMGVQRHLKAAGIFARLNHRDGKPGYLPDIPRTLGYIVAIAGRYPELDWLGQFVAERCLPALEDAA